MSRQQSINAQRKISFEANVTTSVRSEMRTLTQYICVNIAFLCAKMDAQDASQVFKWVNKKTAAVPDHKIKRQDDLIQADDQLWLSTKTRHCSHFLYDNHF